MWHGGSAPCRSKKREKEAHEWNFLYLCSNLSLPLFRHGAEPPCHVKERGFTALAVLRRSLRR